MWNFERYGTCSAIIDEFGNNISYEELVRIGREIAQVIDQRCLVFSLCKNEVGSVVGYLSFINNEIVPVMLNAHLEKELLFLLLDNYMPSYIWAPADMKEEFLDTESVYDVYGYVLLKTNYSTAYELNEELCLLLTTSGSTGSPKFVRQSYINVEENAKSIVEYLELDSSELQLQRYR